MSTPTNVLLIVIDQFRADLLADTGLGAVAQLPNLRALAAECVDFKRHFSVVSPCGPSRVSLFTGQYAMNHRATRNGTPLRHDTPNLATCLRGAGYAPKLFGYTDTTVDPRVVEPDDPRLKSYEELMPGFDEVVRMRMEEDVSAWTAHLAERGVDLPDYPETYRADGHHIRDPALYPAELSDTAFLTDRFLDWMNGADPGWCAALTFIRPHPPFVAPVPYNQMYDAGDMPAAREDDLSHPFLDTARANSHPAKTVVGHENLPDTPEVVADLRALYLGLASEVDHHIGRVVDALKASGAWDDTLLVVTADHGELLGDFGLWGKASFHDAAFHVPLMIRAPGYPDARVISEMTESVDVAPTVLGLLGIDVPASMDGHSLEPHMAGAPTDERVTMSELDFGNPIRPGPWQQADRMTSREANLAVIRQGDDRLVQFGCDYPQILFRDGDCESRTAVGADASVTNISLELTSRLMRHRLAHGEGTFAQMVVSGNGLETGEY